MKFLVLIERDGPDGFRVFVERAELVIDFFILRDVRDVGQGDPPNAEWSIQIEGYGENVRGWKPRFVDDKSVFVEIERLYELCEEWRKRYLEDRA